jgi:hypothetical protein
MATWDDVRRLALALPETDERISREKRQWRVKDKLFAWERPLRAKEIAELGVGEPDGPILGARVEHVGAKQALIEGDPRDLLHDIAFRGLRGDPRATRSDRAFRA